MEQRLARGTWMYHLRAVLGLYFSRPEAYV